MRHIRKDEETLGKYVSKRKAQHEAKRLTNETGVKHIPFFTHYQPVWEEDVVTCWTVIVEPRNKYFG